MTKRFARLLPAAVLALCQLSLFAQSPAQKGSTWADDILKQETYATPPPELADAVLAPRYQNISLSNASPDKKWFLDEVGDGPVVMKTFAKPFHELGGVFIDFKANRARALTIRNNVGIQLISATDGSKKPIQVPAGLRVSNAAWSPDGTSIAYLGHSEDATHIYVADVATGKSRQLTKTPLLATMVSSFEFTDGGKQIAAVLIPDARPTMPPAPTAPVGPTVKLADSAKNRLRTYPSLMASPYEKDLLKWHATGQAALIDVQKGTIRKIGQPTMIRSVDVAPDAKHARVTRMVEPFSYDVPVSSFGSIEEVWDLDGKVLAKLTDRPINLGVQDDTPPQTPPDPAAGGGGRGGQQNQNGKRELAWRPDGLGFTYLEQEPAPEAPAGGRGPRGGGAAAADAQDEPPARGGRGAGQQAQRPDRVYQWMAPFNDASKKVIFENTTRMSGHRFSPDMKVLFFNERVGQNSVDTAVYLAEPAKKFTLARYRADDIYNNPGSIVGLRGGGGGGRGAGGGGGRGGGGGGGGAVMLSADSEHVFYQGTTYSKTPNEVGPKTFIDKVAIRTGEKKRIYESENTNVFERVSTILDADAGKFIITREGPTEVPQQYLVQNGQRTALTKNVDVTPDLTKMKVERFTVERADGFKFRVTVNLPSNFVAGSKPPAIFWFYPREFSDQDSYRSAGPHVQQEHVPELRVAFDGVLHAPRLRGRGAGFPDRRAGWRDEQQLRARPPQQPGGGHRRARQARPRGSHAARHRRPQLRCVLDRQRDGAHAVLQGGHRRRRRLQPHADPARVPERAPRPLGSAERVPEHVAVPVRAEHDGCAADVSRLRRPERGHRPGQLDPAVSRAERPRKDGGALHVSARRPRPRLARNPPRPVGALGRLARQVREEPAEGGAEEDHDRIGFPVTPRIVRSFDGRGYFPRPFLFHRLCAASATGLGRAVGLFEGLPAWPRISRMLRIVADKASRGYADDADPVERASGAWVSWITRENKRHRTQLAFVFTRNPAHPRAARGRPKAAAAGPFLAARI